MYNEMAKSYNGLYEEEQLNKLNIIKKYLKVKKSYKLLDIGCGTGISTNFFDCDSVGVDKSKGMLKFCSEKRILGNAEKLPFKDKSFDVILCITAIHNFDDQEKALNEIKRVKKYKAQIVITLLKKSKNYNKMKKLILRNFNMREMDSDKDTIFISTIN